MQKTAGEKAAACNRIIAAADRCEVCPAAICRREPKRSGDPAIRSFGQFRQFVAFIAAKRDVGELLEPFDLLDFGRYDKIIRLKQIR